MKDKANLEQKAQNIKTQVKALEIKIERLQITKDSLEKQLGLIKRQIELE